MEALKVGIREFRERLAGFLLEIDVPVGTSHATATPSVTTSRRGASAPKQIERR